MMYHVTHFFFITNVAIMSKQWISNKGWWRMGYFPPELGDNMHYMEAVTLERIQSLLTFPGKRLVDYYVI